MSKKVKSFLEIKNVSYKYSDNSEPFEKGSKEYKIVKQEFDEVWSEMIDYHQHIHIFESSYFKELYYFCDEYVEPLELASTIIRREGPFSYDEKFDSPVYKGTLQKRVQDTIIQIIKEMTVYYIEEDPGAYAEYYKQFEERGCDWVFDLAPEHLKRGKKSGLLDFNSFVNESLSSFSDAIKADFDKAFNKFYFNNSKKDFLEEFNMSRELSCLLIWLGISWLMTDSFYQFTINPLRGDQIKKSGFYDFYTKLCHEYTNTDELWDVLNNCIKEKIIEGLQQSPRAYADHQKFFDSLKFVKISNFIALEIDIPEWLKRSSKADLWSFNEGVNYSIKVGDILLCDVSDVVDVNTDELLNYINKYKYIIGKVIKTGVFDPPGIRDNVEEYQIEFEDIDFGENRYTLWLYPDEIIKKININNEEDIYEVASKYPECVEMLYQFMSPEQEEEYRTFLGRGIKGGLWNAKIK